MPSRLVREQAALLRRSRAIFPVNGKGEQGKGQSKRMGDSRRGPRVSLSVVVLLMIAKPGLLRYPSDPLQNHGGGDVISCALYLSCAFYPLYKPPFPVRFGTTNKERQCEKERKKGSKGKPDKLAGITSVRGFETLFRFQVVTSLLQSLILWCFNSDH